MLNKHSKSLPTEAQLRCSNGLEQYLVHQCYSLHSVQLGLLAEGQHSVVERRASKLRHQQGQRYGHLKQQCCPQKLRQKPQVKGVAIPVLKFCVASL